MKAQKSDSVAQLRAEIVRLEALQAEEGRLIKAQLRAVYESITPANLLKSALGAVSESKPNLLASSVGLSLGVLSKALFEGATAGPVRKVLGTLLFFGITKAVSPDNLSFIGKVFNKFRGKPSEKLDEVPTY